jgi:hypothetical protein
METNSIERPQKAGWRLAAYLTLTVLMSCIALAVNVGLIYFVFTLVASYDYFQQSVIYYGGQFVLYVGPFLLLFLQWWLWDTLIDPFRTKKTS